MNCGPEIRNGGGNKSTNDLRDCDMDYNQGDEIRSERNEEVEMDAWCDTGRKDKEMSTVPTYKEQSARKTIIRHVKRRPACRYIIDMKPHEKRGQGGWMLWTQTRKSWDWKERWQMTEYDCKEPSMTIAATPHVGTSLAWRGMGEGGGRTIKANI